MSSTVDNRIVNMQFNNAQFQDRIRTTIKSLNDLKTGLKLEGATANLNNLSRAANTFNLHGVAQGVDAISSRFTNLGIVGVTVLQNLTNSAMAFSKNLVNSLTIKPISTGFDEYELKMNSIGTILTNTMSKGTTLDDVNNALDELNVYADQTIYNFAQMTDNIGKFTAAGVGLQDSVDAVKGMGNLAAAFGVDATKMANATYQMSQALGTGYIQLLDWKSMENAGMGGEMIKKEIIDMANALGKKGVPQLEHFRDTLTEDKWLDNEVFLKTMKKLANDKTLLEKASQVSSLTKLFGVMEESVQSGWAQSWEEILGDKEESKALFSSMYKGFESLVKPSMDARNAALAFWNAQGGRADVIQGLANILGTLRAVLTPVWQIFDNLMPKVTGERLVAWSNAFLYLTEIFKANATSSERVQKVLAGLTALMMMAKSASITLWESLKPLGEKLKPLYSNFGATAAAVGEYLASLQEAFAGTGLFAEVVNNVALVLGYITDAVVYVANGFLALVSSFASVEVAVTEAVAPIEKIPETVEEVGSSFQGLVDKVEEIPEKVEEVGSSFQNLVDKIKGPILKIKEMLSSSLNLDNIKAHPENILKVGLVAVLIKILLFVRRFFKGVAKVTGSFTEVLGEVSKTLKVFQQSIKANAIRSIAVSIAILAASLLLITMIDPEKLSQALGVLVGLFVVLFASMNMFTTLKGDLGVLPILGITVALIGLSIAALILTAAIKKLSKLQWDELVRGLVGAGAALGALALFMKYGKFDTLTLASCAGLILMAIALNIVASAIKKFGSIKTDEMVKGLVGIGVILAEFAIFSNLVKDAKTLTYAALTLLLLGTALKLLAGAVKNMGEMNWGPLLKGLGAMAGALAILTVAFTKMPKNMGSMAIALLAVSIALNMVVYAIKGFGNLPIQNLAKGLLGLAAALAILGIAGFLLAPFAAQILALAIAFGILGLSFMAIGVGIGILAAGLGTLAVVGAVSLDSLSNVMSMFISKIPELFTNIGQGISNLITTLGNNAPAMGEAFVAILTSMMQSVATAIPQLMMIFINMMRDILRIIFVNLPQFVKAGLLIVLNFLKGVASRIRDLVQVGIDIVVNFINGVSSKLESIVAAAFNLMISFINALSDSIDVYAPEIAAAVVKLVMSIVNAMLSMMGIFPTIGEGMIDKVVEGVRNVAGRLTDSMMNAVRTAMDVIKKFLGINSPSKAFQDIGRSTGEGLALGITDMEGSVVTSSEDLGKAATTSMSKALSEIPDALNGELDMQPTIRPVVDLSNVTSGSKSISSLLGQNQSINVAASAGKAAIVNSTMTPNSDAYLLNNLNKSIEGLKSSLEDGDHVINHTGEISVKGINSKEEVVEITKIIAKEFAYGNRRIPARVAIMPSQA